jgi:hypothetical protein
MLTRPRRTHASHLYWYTPAHVCGDAFGLWVDRGATGARRGEGLSLRRQRDTTHGMPLCAPCHQVVRFKRDDDADIDVAAAKVLGIQEERVLCFRWGSMQRHARAEVAPPPLPPSQHEDARTEHSTRVRTRAPWRARTTWWRVLTSTPLVPETHYARACPYCRALRAASPAPWTRRWAWRCTCTLASMRSSTRCVCPRGGVAQCFR